MGRGQEIEQAQTEAIILAAAEGITDPKRIRARKLAARRAVKKRWQDQETLARIKAEDASRGNG